MATLDNHYSYDTYQLWLVVPTTIFSGICSLIIMSLVVIQCCCCCRRVSESDCCDKDSNSLFWSAVCGTVKLLYGNNIKEIKPNTNIYSLNGFILYKRGLLYPLIVVIFVLNSSGIAFWNQFLVDSSSQCDPQMDCFAFNASGSIQESPLMNNCSDYGEDDNYTIECYRFSLRYIDALGSAGGVMALAKAVLSIQTSLWIAFIAKKKKCLMYMVSCGIVVIAIVVFLVVFYVPFLRDRILRTSKNYSLFYTYYIMFCCISTFTGPVLFYSSAASQSAIASELQRLATNVNQSSQEQDNNNYGSGGLTNQQ